MNELKTEWLAFSKQLNLFLEGEITMTKKEFLEKLEHKLHLLKRDEIQDILDEYSGYIDNKLQEGKTEDEAVADFGNLDDLAREILSAYKIDAKYTRIQAGILLITLSMS